MRKLKINYILALLFICTMLFPFVVSADSVRPIQVNVKFKAVTFSGGTFSDENVKPILIIYDPVTSENVSWDLFNESEKMINLTLFKNYPIQYGLYNTNNQRTVLFERNIQIKRHNQTITLKVPEKMNIQWRLNLKYFSADGKITLEEPVNIKLYDKKGLEENQPTYEFWNEGNSEIQMNIIPGKYTVKITGNTILDKEVEAPLFKSRTSTYMVSKSQEALITIKMAEPLQASAEITITSGGEIKTETISQGETSKEITAKAGITSILVMFGTWEENGKTRGGNAYSREYRIKGGEKRLIQLNAKYDYDKIDEKYGNKDPKAITICNSEEGQKRVAIYDLTAEAWLKNAKYEGVPTWEAPITECVTSPALAPGYYKVEFFNNTIGKKREKTINTRKTTNITFESKAVTNYVQFFITEYIPSGSIQFAGTTIAVDNVSIIIANKKTGKVETISSKTTILPEGDYEATINSNGFLPVSKKFRVGETTKPIKVSMTRATQYRRVNFYALIDSSITAPVTINSIKIEAEVVTSGEKEYENWGFEKFPLNASGELTPVAPEGNKQKWIAQVDIPTDRKISVILTAVVNAEAVTFEYSQHMKLKVITEHDKGDNLLYNKETDTWSNVSNSSKTPEFIMPIDLKGTTHSFIVKRKDGSDNQNRFEDAEIAEIRVNIPEVKTRKFGIKYFRVTNTLARKIWLPDNKYMEISGYIHGGIDADKYSTIPFFGHKTEYLEPKYSTPVTTKLKTPASCYENRIATPCENTKYKMPAVFLTYQKSRTHEANIALSFAIQNNNASKPVVGGNIYIEERIASKKRWKEKIPINSNNEHGAIAIINPILITRVIGVPRKNSEYTISGYVKVATYGEKNIIIKGSARKINIPEETLKIPPDALLEGYSKVMTITGDTTTMEAGARGEQFLRKRLPPYVINDPWCGDANVPVKTQTIQTFSILGIPHELIKMYFTCPWVYGGTLHFESQELFRMRDATVNRLAYMTALNKTIRENKDLIGYGHQWAEGVTVTGGNNMHAFYPPENYNEFPFSAFNHPIGTGIDIENDYGTPENNYSFTRKYFGKIKGVDPVTIQDNQKISKKPFKANDEHIVKIILRSSDNELFPLYAKNIDLSQTKKVGEEDVPLTNYKNVTVELKTKTSSKKYNFTSKNLANTYTKSFMITGKYPIEVRIYSIDGYPIENRTINEGGSKTLDITVNTKHLLNREKDFVHGNSKSIIQVSAYTEKPTGFGNREVYVTINPSQLPTIRAITQNTTADAYAFWGGKVHRLEIDPTDNKKTKKKLLEIAQEDIQGGKVKLIFYTSDVDGILQKTWIAPLIKQGFDLKPDMDEILKEAYLDKTMDDAIMNAGTKEDAEMFLWRQKDITVTSEIMETRAEMPYMGKSPSQSQLYCFDIQASSDQGFRANLVDVAVITGFIGATTKIIKAAKTFLSVGNDAKKVKNKINDMEIFLLEQKILGSDKQFKYGNKSFELRSNPTPNPISPQAAEVIQKSTGEIMTLAEFFNATRVNQKAHTAFMKLAHYSTFLSAITQQPYTKFSPLLIPVIAATAPFGGLPPSGMPLITIRSSEESKFIVPNCAGCTENMQITQWFQNHFDKPLLATPINACIQAKKGRTIGIKAIAGGHVPFSTFIHINENTPTRSLIEIPLTRNTHWGFSSTQNFFESHPALQEAVETITFAPEMYAGSNVRSPLLEFIAQGLTSLIEAVAQDFKITGGVAQCPPGYYYNPEANEGRGACEPEVY